MRSRYSRVKRKLFFIENKIRAKFEKLCSCKNVLSDDFYRGNLFVSYAVYRSHTYNSVDYGISYVYQP